MESAGRTGARLGKVSELTIIVPLAPGGAQRLRAFLRVLRGNLSQGADKVGTLQDMRFVFFDNDTRLLFATAYDGDWDTWLAQHQIDPEAEFPVGRVRLGRHADVSLAELATTIWVSTASRRFDHYWQLTKPKVVAAIVFTAIVGMLLAAPGLPPLDLMLRAALGIWLAASSAAALNHVLDRKFDAEMRRTRQRPLPSGQLTTGAALIFAGALGVLSMLILSSVNLLTALLTLASLIGYSVLYTVWLKHLTPHNIVIGGAAGAMPPVLGWATVTNGVTADALLLFGIIFTWTPPHFWALAVARRDDYAKAGIPMLPVTHGAEFTCSFIVLYTVLLIVVTVLPYLTGMSGLIYLAGAILLNAAFLGDALALRACPSPKLAMRTFRHSIHYLLLLFTFLLVDHYVRAL